MSTLIDRYPNAKDPASPLDREGYAASSWHTDGTFVDAYPRARQEHITRPENVVRWRWQAGDFAFWDERGQEVCDRHPAPR